VFSALLDTCVLVPSRARDVLLKAAAAGVYRPRWSSEILAELDRTLRLLQARRGMAPEETDAYLVRLFRQMETSFPDALVTDWESLLDAVQLPDPGDCHVVAAARAGHADVIVADFPPGALPAPLIRQSLDEFLLSSLDLHPGQVISAIRPGCGCSSSCSGPSTRSANARARRRPRTGRRRIWLAWPTWLRANPPRRPARLLQGADRRWLTW
jgi:predicted nucleic acid-binding protein